MEFERYVKRNDEAEAKVIELACHLGLKMKLRSFVIESDNLNSSNFMKKNIWSLLVEVKMILLVVKKKQEKFRNFLCHSISRDYV